MDYYELLADYDDVLLAEDVKKILKTGMNTVYMLLKTGAIKSLKPSKRIYRIPKPFMVEYLKNNDDSVEDNDPAEEKEKDNNVRDNDLADKNNTKKV